MRLRHFEALAPICPRCRGEQQRESPLVIADVAAGDDARVLHGALHCSDAGCRLEYPVIDGIPIIVAHLRTLLADQIASLTARVDLPAATESLLGDATGPGSEYDTRRQHLSIYGWDAYGEFATDEPTAPSEPRPGAVARLLEAGLGLTGPLAGPIIDLGCSVGRATFELARLTGQLVVGVDLGFAMLRLARSVQDTGTARFPLRRVGVVYDERALATPYGGCDGVEFWLCDAAALPFRPGTFGAAVALNLLDCVASPLTLLGSVVDALQPGGRAVLASPYDWSANATPMEAWLGGHSQRAPAGGATEPLLRTLLTPGAHPRSLSGCRIVGELPAVPWHTRLHARSTMTYASHVLAVEKVSD